MLGTPQDIQPQFRQSLSPRRLHQSNKHHKQQIPAMQRLPPLQQPDKEQPITFGKTQTESLPLTPYPPMKINNPHNKAKILSRKNRNELNNMKCCMNQCNMENNMNTMFGCCMAFGTFSGIILLTIAIAIEICFNFFFMIYTRMKCRI